MAEALLKHHAADLFLVESAGLEPGKINPLAIKAMRKKGINISKNEPNSVFDYLKQGRHYNFVITVCDESQSERCPIFPGRNERLHWSFSDPAALTGSEEEKLQKTIDIRDEIEAKIKEFINSVKEDLLQDF